MPYMVGRPLVPGCRFSGGQTGGQEAGGQEQGQQQQGRSHAAGQSGDRLAKDGADRGDIT